MIRHISQDRWVPFGIGLVAVLTIAVLSACRVRPAPGSVTPVSGTTVADVTSVPDSYPPPGEVDTPVGPTSTPINGEGSGSGEVTEPPTLDATPSPEVTISVPTETPAATATATVEVPPTATAAGGGSPSGLTPGTTVQHRVVKGEWLLQIARCYGTSYEGIRAANRLSRPDLILVNATINVPALGSTGPILGPPCVVSYVVQPGDSWEGLAQRFGTSITILRRANPGNLIAGQSIWVPRTN